MDEQMPEEFDTEFNQSAMQTMRCARVPGCLFQTRGCNPRPPLRTIGT
jgi:hypothetical protein